MKEIIEIYFYDRSKRIGENLLSNTVIPAERNIPHVGDDVEINGIFCTINKIVYNENFTRIDFLVSTKGVNLHRKGESHSIEMCRKCRLRKFVIKEQEVE